MPRLSVSLALTGRPNDLVVLDVCQPATKLVAITM